MKSYTLNKSGVFAFCLYLVVLLCFTSEISAREVPPLKGLVNDYGEIIHESTEKQLQTILRDLEETDSTQIVVLTIDSLEGDVLEEYSLKVAETWKLGQAGYDNGALLLVAVKDRKVRIEVGYGLEGELTDLLAGRIIRNDILPRFKQGDFDHGITAGVNSIALAVRGAYTGESSGKNMNTGDDPFGLIGMLLFYFFFIGNIFRKSKTISAIAGGVGAPLLATLFFGFHWLLFSALIPIGVIAGLLASVVLAKSSLRKSRSFGGGFASEGSGNIGIGGSGGFSGGGGGFGGGGASGGW